MTSLTKSELTTIYQTLVRYKETKEVQELSDLFTENPRLIISPSNQCNKSCFHCVADSVPNEKVMPYSNFTNIDPKFIQIFSVADFGRRGNPLLYNSENHDLVDLMKFLNENGINEFTLALAIQDHLTPITRKLEDLASEGINIETMITYHHYFSNLDPNKLAQEFNATLKNYFGFSKKILISLLGDQHAQQPTKAEEVQSTFQDHWEIIFDGIDIFSEDNETYHAEYENRQVELLIPSIDTRVYPLGRFRQYLLQQGTLEQYEEQFEQSMSDYVCPDLIKWPGIIIEPNGDLNLCASFEAITCKRAIISNILTKTFSEVKEELKQFHQREMDWFIENIDEIVAGNTSTCKLKNNCYQTS